MIPASQNVRGVRSNFITMSCYDLQNDEWEVIELDIRKPITRFVPEFLL